MKLEDRVYDDNTERVGYIGGEPCYKYESGALPTTSSLILCYPVIMDDGSGYGTWVKAENIRLEDTPQIVQFMTVQISMHSDTSYYGMSGIVTELDGQSAKVRLFGYRKPLTFGISDLEPLNEGTDLECWLDSLSDVKGY